MPALLVFGTIVHMYLGIAIGIVIGYFLGQFFVKKSSGTWTTSQAKKYAAEGREAVQKRIHRRKEKIMIFANKEGRLVNDDVEDMFCISDNTATNYLGELVDEGKLEMFGDGRGVYYKPKS